MKALIHPHLNKPWSSITLGGWQIAPSLGWGDTCSLQQAEKVIKTALDIGITAFDTAEGYGDNESERRLNQFLGNRKDDVIIISKIWPDAALSFEAYQERLDRSLLSLGRDYIDVYLIHWPGNYFHSQSANAFLHDTMLRFKESGKIRTAGLSNFYDSDLQRLGDQRLPSFDFNEISASLLDTSFTGTTNHTCQQHQIELLAYSPLAKGLLARALSQQDLNTPARSNDVYYLDNHYNNSLKVQNVVFTTAQKLGWTPAEVALSWILAQPNIRSAIIGTRKPEQLLELQNISSRQLPPEELNSLNTISEKYSLKSPKIIT